MSVAVSGNQGDDSIGALHNGNQIGDQQMPSNLFSNGQAGFCSDIINQYGQFIGEYGRLDDELWFSKPDSIDHDYDDDDDDDALARTDVGLESNVIISELKSEPTINDK